MKRLLSLIAALTLVSCASLDELPRDATAAFALRDPLASHTTWMETFVVKATMAQALSAAEYALLSTRFYPRPESYTDDRRCGEYTTGLNEWGMWNCFYFLRAEGEALRARVIVESWNSFGAILVSHGT